MYGRMLCNIKRMGLANIDSGLLGKVSFFHFKFSVFLSHEHRTNATARMNSFHPMYVLQLETELAVERRNHEDKRRRLKRRGKEAETARRRLQQENALLNEQLAVSNERLGVLQRLKEGRRCVFG